jgi:hypothetical protein
MAKCLRRLNQTIFTTYGHVLHTLKKRCGRQASLPVRSFKLNNEDKLPAMFPKGNVLARAQLAAAFEMVAIRPNRRQKWHSTMWNETCRKHRYKYDTDTANITKSKLFNHTKNSLRPPTSAENANKKKQIWLACSEMHLSREYTNDLLDLQQRAN